MFIDDFDVMEQNDGIFTSAPRYDVSLEELTHETYSERLNGRKEIGQYKDIFRDLNI